MIWVGGGARHAAGEILALAERIGAPVVSLRTGRGIVDDDHPLGLTVPAGHALWPETDLVLGFGTRLDVPLQRWRGGSGERTVVRIDIDPAEQRRLKVDLFVLADAAAAAGALAAAVAPRHDAGRAAAIAAAKAAGAAAALKVQPQMAFLAAIRAALPRQGILCEEMTQTGYAAWFGFPVHRPRDLITSGFSGTLGAGFPMALGVKVANPRRPVVALAGDGGFLFAATELATARHHGIGLVTVLFNNGAYGNVLRDQRRLFDGREAGAVLTNPDFQAFSRIEDAQGLGAALGQALATEGPALVEVMTDASREASPWEFLYPSGR
jgi:acetolactate synthase-1/2/3 large subunit